MKVDARNISWWRTSFGEEEVEKIRESVLGEHISQGPVTEQFEQELATALNVPYVVATTSGSVALLMGLMAMGIGQDDEVIIPDRTWVATAHAAKFLGAKVVLADVQQHIPTIDVSQVRALVTNRTKAIMPVHINGRGEDMAEVRAIAREYGLYVIEDACQALFSKYSEGFLGTQSDVGCFSLGVGKLISTGQGGFLATKSQTTYERLKLIRNHGVVDNFTDEWKSFGFNFKFTDLLASFGLVQLGRAPDRVRHVNDVYARYADAMTEFEFSSIKLIPVKTERGEVPLYAEVLCDDRERLIQFLGSRGIQTRPYPPSLHTSEYLNDGGQFPCSLAFHGSGLYLPCGPDQPLENVDRVIESLRDYENSR